MANLFAGSDVVELGVQVEKNGRDFYNELCKNADSEKAKKIFEYLEGEEEKHITDFEKLLSMVHQYDPPESYPGEYFAYMNALASEYVFTQKDKGREIAKGITSELQAVDLGIGFEKDSIVFFEGMKRVIPDKDYKVIENLILQEQEHLGKLLELKRGL